jgi:peptidoglycan/xylan/chitin deacetylase (PgdA/CDA1 family)
MMIQSIGGVACAAVGFMTYAVRGRSSALFGPSVWRGDPGRAAIALTFDDGPSESTPDLLRVLAGHGARATFFQCGMHARRLPGIARQVAAAGHEIGNHGDTHAPFYLRSPQTIYAQLARAQEAIAAATGVTPRLFRAPYGCRWFGLRAAQRRLGLMGVMWTAVARDWKLAAPAVAARLVQAARNGAILCLHDGRVAQTSPDIRVTIEAMRALLPALAEKGYHFETVSELLCPKN